MLQNYFRKFNILGETLVRTCFTSVIMWLQACGVKPDGFSGSGFSTASVLQISSLPRIMLNSLNKTLQVSSPKLT